MTDVEPVLRSTLQFSTLVEVRVVIFSWSVSGDFSWKTALRILAKLCMNVQHNKNKKRTRPFFREKSASLIIHENVFWPFLANFLLFRWFILADIVNLDR